MIIMKKERKLGYYMIYLNWSWPIHRLCQEKDLNAKKGIK